MVDTPTKPAAASFTSGQLFGELIKELKKHPADVEQRVVAHIRETTQHATLPSYHNNGADEADKIKMYAFLLLAVRQDMTRLKGTVAQDQPAKPEPAAEAETPQPTPPKPQRIEVNGDKVSEAVSALVEALRGEMRAMVNDELQRLINE